jgi:hypothetical protein
MSIRGVESLLYGVEDLALACRFFEDWGLACRHRGERGADFALPDRTTVCLRPIDDHALPAPLVPGSTVRETVWGVDSGKDIDTIAAELAKDRAVRQSADGILHAVDDLGYAVGFKVTTREAVTMRLADTNTVGGVSRRDARAAAALAYRVRPQRFVHVVYWIPQRLLARARDFYVGRLGFCLTESVATSGHFLRCGPHGDHHNLFLNCRGDNFGFQHVAFEVRDIDEMMMAGQYMERHGWKTHLGPGRHVVGSNVYWYFWCPAGGCAEIGCDIDCITDHWQPLEHETMPGGGSSWFVRPEDEGLRPGHGEGWPQYQG